MVSRRLLIRREKNSLKLKQKKKQTIDFGFAIQVVDEI